MHKRADKITENTIHLAFSSNPKFMKLLRQSIEFACIDMGLTDFKPIVFAIDEACTNIIRHAYKMDFSQKIEICVQWTPKEKIDFFLCDFAEKVDLSQIKPRDLNEIRPGQMGVSIYHEVMDEVEWIQQNEVGNTLHFVKYFQSPSKKKDCSS